MHAFHGQLVAIVQANAQPGELRLTATGKGLKPATLTLKAGPAAQ